MPIRPKVLAAVTLAVFLFGCTARPNSPTSQPSPPILEELPASVSSETPTSEPTAAATSGPPP
ncbi:MAG: hypothetical protein WEC37_03330, partial [Anaerolineales bacterium]